MTNPMTTQLTDNLFSVSYPCYVAAIPNESIRILHIPGVLEYREFDNSYGFVVEAYKTDKKVYVFDCIPLDLWHKQKCLLTYERRLKYVKSLVNEVVADYKKVIDINNQIFDNSPELYDYLSNLLTMGYKRVRITYMHGNYVFGKSSKGEYMEVEIEEIIRQRVV